MEIQQDLRRSYGLARDNTVELRSTRCTQKRNVESSWTRMGAGCAGDSEKYSTCQFMSKHNLDLEFQNCILTEKQAAGVAFAFVRLTARVSRLGWDEVTRIWRSQPQATKNA